MWHCTWTWLAGTVLLLSAVLTGAARCTSPSDSASQDTSSQARTAQPDTLSSSTFAAPPGIGVPEDMVYVPSGSTKIGITLDQWRRLRAQQPPGPRPLFGRDAHPPFRAEVGSFFLDEHPVTVAQFREFVDSTGHTTQAETFGTGGVLRGGGWKLVEGATWHHPRGPRRPPATDSHPVTQVSWNDAHAYCSWAGKRLPTEVEWEHAARIGRKSRTFCVWGENCQDHASRVEHANTWQGSYPVRNTAEDGYRYTSPVGEFGDTALGLQDMSGNVWEWTASWKRPYRERGTDFRPTRGSKRVQRGGSFICHECGGYYVFARSASTPRTSLFHVGFRCAKDVDRD